MTTTPPPPTTRLGIAIDLDGLRQLMREFIDEHEKDEELKVSLDWTFETFLQWLRKRQEMNNEAKTTYTQQQAVNSTAAVSTGKNSVVLSDERLQGARRNR